MEWYWFSVLTVLILNAGYIGSKPVCKFGAKLDEEGKCVCPNSHVQCASNTQICGSNGVTYQNSCELKKDTCRLQVALFVFKAGRCGHPSMACASISCSGLFSSCPAGRVQDDYGCLRCQCRSSLKAPCPMLSTCALNCTSTGHVIDDHSCPTCVCKKAL